jgi:SAM-dependent methyltransferase
MHTRRDILLDGLDTTTLVGAEVGPLDNPLVLKDQGAVFYVDHCDTEALKARWSGHATVDAKVLHVDAVWGAASLREALATADAADPAVWGGVDYVVASHVVEHVPDLVSWLREVGDVLRPDGSLRLAVPDKRYTFDLLRRTSHLSEVADAFIRKRRAPSGSRVLDFALNMVKVDCGKAWRGTLDMDALEFYYTREGALRLARDAEENGVYHDVHCWVFTPRSFADLMVEMARTGLLELACDRIVPTMPDTFEFFVAMRPAASAAEVEASWRQAADGLPTE